MEIKTQVLWFQLLLFWCTALGLKSQEDSQSMDDYWESYKVKHGKKYSKSEEVERKKIFEERLHQVVKHNLEADLGMKSFRVSLNHLADMKPGEKTRGLKVDKANPHRRMKRASATRSLKKLPVPDSFDWRKLNKVSSVKDQKDCGACWAFTAAGALESHYAIQTGILYNLSAQQLLDCVTNGVDGCLGGSMNPAFEFVMKNGITSEEKYPYEEEKKACHYDNRTAIIGCRGYVEIEPGDEEAIKYFVASVGPVCVGLYGESPYFQLYSNGIYNDVFCESEPTHGVLIVGYGSSQEKDYWIIKNSWGPQWGVDGYGYVQRNVNACGIASIPSYPVV